jgi:beta-glucosidase
VERPEKELRAFAKLTLEPGATGTAVLTITQRDLAYFDVESRAFRADAGVYALLIAAHAGDVRSVVEITNTADWIGAV